LPGGIGTLEELFEIYTWLQLGLHDKPIGILNVAGFFDHMLALLDHMVADCFLRADHRAMLVIDDDMEGLLKRMTAFVAPDANKWLDTVAKELR
ncbi:MAG: Rossman fold protein family, partial [Verrucomicrobiaceae bacterium]|nr:Rossman fold protein family [Verrucomicrobiaceae bacterium]